MDTADSPQFQRAWLKPRYWGIWLGWGFAWLLVKLPLSWLYALGGWLGRASMPFATYRRRVCATNIRLCFPHYTPREQQQLVCQCFRSLGISMIETVLAWRASDKKIAQLKFNIENLQELQQQLAKNPRVLALGFHFTTLELIGRLLSIS